MCRLNVFDFDNTIYDGDSSIDFYIFCLKRNNYNFLTFSYESLFLFHTNIGD